MDDEVILEMIDSMLLVEEETSLTVVDWVSLLICSPLVLASLEGVPLHAPSNKAGIINK